MPSDYSLGDLAALAEVTTRTVRYYIAQGLLPAPGGAGRGARYTAAHLARLRLVRRLQSEHLPLAEIRTRLAGMPDTDVAGLVGGESAESEPGTSALEYVRAVLARQGSRHGATGIAAGALMAPRRSRLTSVARSAVPAAPSPAVSPTDAAPTGPSRSAPTILERLGPAGLLATVPHVPVAPPGPIAPLVPPMDPPAPAAPFGSPPAASPATLGPPSDERTAAVETPAAVGPARSQWERIALGPDVEIHVRRPLGRRDIRRVERLLAFARQLFEGEAP